MATEKAASRYGDNKATFLDNNDVTLVRIREVALRYFCTYGFSRTGMREIASRSKLSPAALYHRFSSKEALRSSLREWLFKQCASSAVVAIDDDLSMEENLIAVLVAWTGEIHRIYYETPHGHEFFVEEMGIERVSPVNTCSHDVVYVIERNIQSFEENDGYGLFCSERELAEYVAQVSLALTLTNPDRVVYLDAVRLVCATAIAACRRATG